MADYTAPVTPGFDAPADYYADADVAAAASAALAARGTPFEGSAAAYLIDEACDGDIATARAVLALARQETA